MYKTIYEFSKKFNSMVFSLKKNFTHSQMELTEGVKDAIFHFFSKYLTKKQKIEKKIVKYCFNQVKGFPKWYHSLKSLEK